MTSLSLLLDASFGPLILQEFLGGIYCLLFCQALWKLLRRQAHVPYTFALVLLWISITSSLIQGWVLKRNIFVVNNSSPISMVEDFKASPAAAGFVPMFVANVVSDGILIWRCHVLWQTTWSLIILIPLFLASSAFNLYFGIAPLGTNSAILFLGLSQFISAATTVCATVMIALKIILVTRKSQAHYSYTKVIEILVQSAALESFVMIVSSITEFVGYALLQSNSRNVALGNLFVQILGYVSVIRILVTGIAPTLIAFRVADEKPRNEANATNRTTPPSRLTFRRTARRTDTEIGARRTPVPAIRFGSTQRDGSVISVHSEADLNNERVTLGTVAQNSKVERDIKS